MINVHEEVKINNLAGVISLLVVPLMFTLSELFHLITMDTITEEIISAEKFHNKWLIAHLLVLVSIIFLPFLLNKLSDYINKKYIKIVNLSNFIAHIGITSITGLLIYDFLLLDAGTISDINVVSSFLETISKSIFGIIFLKIGPIFFFIGFLILLILQLLSKLVKTWTTVLIIVGLLIYALAGPLVPVKNGHIIVSLGALIMLIGFAGIFFNENKRA